MISLRTIETPLEPDAQAGFGTLETARGRLPMVALSVHAQCLGLDTELRIRQEFVNSTSEMLEATYIFPLPDRMAATSFVLRVADREIRGLLKERGEARQEYDRAIAQGHRAAIAEEDRSGVFSLRVGNLPPGERATVEFTLVGTLPVNNGEATFRFPLVVAPRYTPGIPLDGVDVGLGTQHDTDLVPDASRISPPVLLPGFPNPVRLTIDVTIDISTYGLAADDWLAALEASLHSVTATRDGNTVHISLQPGERLNRDFLLRFPVSGDVLTTSAVVHVDDDEQATFAIQVFPPKLPPSTKPRDVVFVLDRSGSMEGWKMVAARRALGRMIDTLTERDTFRVIAFDTQIDEPPSLAGQQAATDRHRWQAVQWLSEVDARGGTEMGPALQLAVSGVASTKDNNREALVVLVTDGQVSGEDHLLRVITQAGGKRLPRMFCLGIDRAVNAGFLNRLAQLTSGSCDLVESEDRLDSVLAKIHTQLATPVLRDVRIESPAVDWESGQSIFEGVPHTVHGRRNKTDASKPLVVTATTQNGTPWRAEIVPQLVQCSAVKANWARGRIRSLEDRYAAGNRSPELSQEIIKISLAANVLSRFTAFVAVDKSEIVNSGGKVNSVVQAVEAPEGWAQRSVAMSAPGGATMDYMMVERGGSLDASPKMRRMSRGGSAAFKMSASKSARMEEDACLPCAPPPPSAAPAPTANDVADWLRQTEDFRAAVDRLDRSLSAKKPERMDAIRALKDLADQLAPRVAGQKTLEDRLTKIQQLCAALLLDDPRDKPSEAWIVQRQQLLQEARRLLGELGTLPDPNTPGRSGSFWV
jgi:Ca-activated chloride channel family protein